MKFKLLFSFILLFSGCFNLFGQIPDSIKFDWNRAGVDSSFSMPLASIDIISLGAIPNDGLDDSPAIQLAFANIAAGGAIVLFPAGMFNFSASINVPSGCIVKGSGADSTFFVFDFGGSVGNCFNFIGSGSANSIALSSAISKGSAYAIVSNASTTFSSGDRIEIYEQNGSWDIVPAFWAGNSVGHITTIDSVWGDTIRMKEPVRIDFDLVLNPQIHKLLCVENSGVQCLNMTRVDSIAPSINYGIYFFNAFNCVVSGVESYKSIGAHIWAEASAHLTVERNYFHSAYTYDGSNTRGYGVVMAVHTCLSKIENNIFKTLRHSMMVKQGANGNVFGYNYSTDPNRSEFPSNYGADICLHGHFPFANLFEGNINQNTAIDQAFGPSGPGNTFFRNRMELYGFIMTSGSVQSNLQSVIGNDIPSTTLFQGNYLINGAGHFEMANRVKNVITPVGSNILSDSSLYLNSSPVYWASSLQWPSIGIPVSQAFNVLPATQRFLLRTNLAPCEEILDSSSTGVATSFEKQNGIKIYYSNKNLHLRLPSDQNEVVDVVLVDLAGKTLLVHSKMTIRSSMEETIYVKLNCGIYICRVAFKGEYCSFKIPVVD